MSSSVVLRWLRLFNVGHENVHDDPRSGRPSVVNEDLVRAVEEEVRENRWFTITPLSLHFSQIWRSLHKIVSEVKEAVTTCFASQAASFYDEVTKPGATLWQVPQQWWKLCRKVVYGVYIKWQCAWFLICSCFFLNSPSDLTSWITLVIVNL